MVHPLFWCAESIMNARLWRRMEHSNIARILDAGASSRGRPFFVMDYVEGACITAY